MKPNKLAGVKRAPGGKARVFVGAKITEEGRDEVDEYAARETNGNRSEMVRRMIAEGCERRRARAGRRT